MSPQEAAATEGIILLVAGSVCGLVVLAAAIGVVVMLVWGKAKR